MQGERFVYFADPIFREFRQTGNLLMRNTWRQAMIALIGTPPFGDGLPKTVNSFPRRRGDDLILTLLHYIPMRKALEIDVIEEASSFAGERLRLPERAEEARIFNGPALERVADGAFLLACGEGAAVDRGAGVFCLTGASPAAWADVYTNASGHRVRQQPALAREQHPRAAASFPADPAPRTPPPAPATRRSVSAATPRFVRRPNAMALRPPHRGRHVFLEIRGDSARRGCARCTRRCRARWPNAVRPPSKTRSARARGNPPPASTRGCARTRARAGRSWKSRTARNPAAASVSAVVLEQRGVGVGVLRAVRPTRNAGRTPCPPRR